MPFLSYQVSDEDAVKNAKMPADFTRKPLWMPLSWKAANGSAPRFGLFVMLVCWSSDTLALPPRILDSWGGAKPREEPQIRQWNLSKMPGLYRLQAHLPCWWTYIINHMVDVEDEMNIKTKALRVEVAHVPSTQGVDWENNGIITSDGDCEIYSRPETSFLYDFEACVKNTTLPVMFLSESVNDSRYIQEMAAACVGERKI